MFPLQQCIQCNGGPFSSCTAVGSGGAGVPNTDFVLYVSALNINPCGAGSSTIAFAASCEMEQVLDRYEHICAKESCHRQIDTESKYIFSELKKWIILPQFTTFLTHTSVT